MSMNFNYTTNPGYIDLVRDTYRAASWHYRSDNWHNYTVPYSFFYDLRHYCHVPVDEMYQVLIICLLFTIVRYAFQYFVCQVSAHLVFVYNFFCNDTSRVSCIFMS